MALPPTSPGGPDERPEAQRTSGSSRGLTAPSIPRPASHPPWLLSQTQSRGGCSAGIPRSWRKAGPGPRSLLWTSSPRLTAALLAWRGMSLRKPRQGLLAQISLQLTPLLTAAAVCV